MYIYKLKNNKKNIEFENNPEKCCFCFKYYKNIKKNITLFSYILVVTTSLTEVIIRFEQ